MFTRIYASTFLRIYISAAIIRGSPTHLHCRFRCRQHNNTRELNRTDVTNNTTTSTREEERNTQSIVAEIHVMEGVAGDKLMSNMSDTTTPALNQHNTCVCCLNMSTSNISDGKKAVNDRWKCRPEDMTFVGRAFFVQLLTGYEGDMWGASCCFHH